MSSSDYVLRSIVPTTQTVPRCAAIMDDNTIAIGSTNGTLHVFEEKDGIYTAASEAVKIHDGPVYSLLPMIEDHPQYVGTAGCLISGGGDKLAKLVTVDGATLIEFVGHTAPVEGLAFGTDTARTLLTGGWDGSVRGWRNDECLFQDDRNQFAVQLLSLPGGLVVTGSGSKALSVYELHPELATPGSAAAAMKRVVHVENAHGHSIRKIISCALGLVTCGNDGFIKVWSHELDLLASVRAWTPTRTQAEFIYDVVFVGGLVVACGDDKKVKTFDFGMTDAEPLVGEWTLPEAARTMYVLPNADLLLVTAQGVFVFTKADSGRAAGPELQEQFRELLTAKGGAGDGLKLDSLPSMDALLVAGKKAGEYKVVNIEGRPMVVSWSAEKLIWELVGEAMGQQEQEKKEHYQGVDYDHVVDVELGPGMPPLKLPFNRDDDPLEVASAFLATHGLAADALGQIVEFIQPYIDQEALTRRRDAQAAAEEAGHVSGLAKDNWAYTVSGAFTPRLLEMVCAKIDETNADRARVSAASSLSEPELSVVREAVAAIAQGRRVPDDTPVVLSRLCAWPAAARLPVLDLTRLVFGHEASLAATFDPTRLDAPFAAISKALFEALGAAASPVAGMEPSEAKRTGGLALMATQALTNYLSKRAPTPMERNRGMAANPIPQTVLTFISAAFALVRDIHESHPRAADEALRFVANMVSWLNRNPANATANEPAYRDAFMYTLMAAAPGGSLAARLQAAPAQVLLTLQILAGIAVRLPVVKGIVATDEQYVRMVKTLITAGNMCGGSAAVLAKDVQKLVL